MSEIVPEPMRADKDDRYSAAESKKSPGSSIITRLFNSNNDKKSVLTRKTLIVLLLLVILILLGSFLLSGSSSELNDEESANTVTTTNTNSNEQPQDYKEIQPPAISREATQTKVEEQAQQERLEIPGEITDLIAQKITDLNANNSTDTTDKGSSQPVANNTTRLELNRQAAEPQNGKFNQLPLSENLSSTHYTIQLSGSSSLENLMNYAKKYKVTNYQIYETRKNQAVWFVLIQGDYPTLNDAKAALNALPAALKTNQPWVKSGLSVQKEKQ